MINLNGVELLLNEAKLLCPRHSKQLIKSIQSSLWEWEDWLIDELIARCAAQGNVLNGIIVKILKWMLMNEKIWSIMEWKHFPRRTVCEWNQLWNNKEMEWNGVICCWLIDGMAPPKNFSSLPFFINNQSINQLN